MLKKLTALFLSLLLCLSLLPSQAGAMDDSEDESSVQAEDMENPGSPDDGDAPDRATAWGGDEGNGGPGLPSGDPSTAANGKKYGLYDPSNPFKP